MSHTERHSSHYMGTNQQINEKHILLAKSQEGRSNGKAYKQFG